MQSEDYPALYRSADKSAMVQQSWHFGCLKTFLIVLSVGAVLSLFPDANRCAAIAAAVLFSLTIGVTLLMAFKRFDKMSYSARAIAESVKTRAWRYMMQAEPYDVDDSEARKRFAQDLGCILKDNIEAVKIIPALKADTVTDEMDKVRAFSLDEKKKFYKAHRVDNQLNWYTNQTAFNRQRNDIWFVLMVLFQLGALLCVIVKLNSPDIKPMPTVLFTTLAGIALSWTQAKRFGELSASYNLTAHEISIISSKYTKLLQEQDFTSFVRDSESAFSREHTQWIARRGI